MVKRKRNLKTFIQRGKRYRVVYSTNTEKDARIKASKLYGPPYTGKATVFYDSRTESWLVGVLPKGR